MKGFDLRLRLVDSPARRALLTIGALLLVLWLPPVIWDSCRY